MKTLKECTQETVEELLKKIPEQVLADRIQFMLEEMDLWDHTLVYDELCYKNDDSARQIMKSMVKNLIKGGDSYYRKAEL